MKLTLATFMTDEKLIDVFLNFMVATALISLNNRTLSRNCSFGMKEALLLTFKGKHAVAKLTQ
jgi:hypothetical protein